MLALKTGTQRKKPLLLLIMIWELTTPVKKKKKLGLTAPTQITPKRWVFSPSSELSSTLFVFLTCYFTFLC